MTTRTVLPADPARRPFAGRIRSFPSLVRRVFQALAARDRIYREHQYLAELDDRMLRDIGLTRADVDAELRRPIPWASLLPRG